MKMNLKAILLFSVLAFGLGSCYETDEKPKDSSKKQIEKGTPDDGRGAEYEEFIAKIDNSDTLIDANTLYYTKNNGESYQVYIKLDANNELVRIEEKYTTSASGSVLTNFYYYKDGDKFATKEHYVEVAGQNEKFVERVSYYADGKPKISKIRRAPYEEYLQNELFEIIKPYDCSDEKAVRALQRKGEFQTNFVSTVREDAATYVIVGEGPEDGYVSALVVQRITPLVNQLINNPNGMKGKALSVTAQEMSESTGFTFQILLDIALEN